MLNPQADECVITQKSLPVTRNQLDRSFCTAPMMDWSDRHCRHFWRQLTKHSVLYTEMVTTGALLYSGDHDRFLAFDGIEHPIALQLGGSDPVALASCVQLAEKYGYDEVNLNVGCPSDRVQNNKIGACLMAEPELVRDCVASMLAATSRIPITVKHRIGIDDEDSYESLANFVGTVAEAGCDTFIVHARKAILQGLSPKENREIPPLEYDKVYRLKQDFPHLEIILNGGLKDWPNIESQLNKVDGVMIGREAYQNPWILSDVDHRCYGQASSPSLSRKAVFTRWRPYLEEKLEQGTPLQHLLRHVLGTFHGQPGGRLFRRTISELAYKKGAGIEVLDKALAAVRD